MSPRPFTAPAVRHLDAVVDDLAGSVGPDRMKQLRMVVGMWDRAVARGGFPESSTRTPQRLFTRPVLAAFWELAVAGELRHVDRHPGKVLPVATQRIVRDCLAILGRRVLPAGRRLVLPSIPNEPLKDTVDARAVHALYRGLVDLAGGEQPRYGAVLLPEDRARLLAVVSVVLDAAPRSGELAAMRLTDLAAGEAAIAVRRQQQKAGPNRAEEIAALAEVHADTVRSVLWGQVEKMSEATLQRVLAAQAELEPLPEVEWYALREGSRVAVRRWLAVRERIVEALPIEGGKSALWVTLRESKAGPKGITIQADGLRNAYARGITALNVDMAGTYGWSPLPTTMEQLRRGIDVTPLDRPPAGNGQ